MLKLISFQYTALVGMYLMNSKSISRLNLIHFMYLMYFISSCVSKLDCNSWVYFKCHCCCMLHIFFVASQPRFARVSIFCLNYRYYQKHLSPTELQSLCVTCFRQAICRQAYPWCHCYVQWWAVSNLLHLGREAILSPLTVIKPSWYIGDSR